MVDLFTVCKVGISSKDKYEKQVKHLSKCAIAYYNSTLQMMTDEDYDKEYKELLEYEKANPLDINPLSPTQYVGAKVSDGFIRRAHLQKMYSINDAFSEEEIIKWCKNLEKVHGKLEYMCELKFDGGSLNLIYENSVLKHAITRGDGVEGEDVTANAAHIEGIPRVISFNKDTICEIRGEVCMTFESFELNQKMRLASGKELFANPRNAASGSLRQLDPMETKKRKLVFFPFSINGDTALSTQEDLAQLIDSDSGFKSHSNRWVCKNVLEVLDAFKNVSEIRDQLPFGIDGMVIKVNSLKAQEKMGFNRKYPKWCLAAKLPAVEKKTKIIDILIQVGKDGSQNPVALVVPTDIDGSIVEKATLHNFKEIQIKDIRIGDSVSIFKSGDIIPAIGSVFKEERSGDEVIVLEPTHCKSCDSVLLKKPLIDGTESVGIYCVNDKCPARLSRYIRYIAQRKVLDIASLGDTVAEQLSKIGVVNVLDLLNLTIAELNVLDGFAAKKAKKLYDNIQAIVGNTTLDKIIVLLQSKDLGTSISEHLVSELKMDAFNPDVIDSFTMEGISNNVFKNYAYLLREKSDYVQELLDVIKPIVQDDTEVELKSSIFEGLNICITGTLEKPRDEYVNIIEQNGGKFVKKVNGKTNVLCIGSNVGKTKIEAAEKLGVRVVQASEFFKDVA